MTFNVHPRRNRGISGFSLIEVIFAIALLGIGIVGILGLFTSGLSSATKSQNSSAASMEVQSLLTRILTESVPATSANPISQRIVLNYIHMPTDPPGSNNHEWIQFDQNMNFAGSNQPILIDSNRDLYWSCRCKPVHSDKDASGNIVLWYPPMNPDNPLDTAYSDASASPNYVNGLYEIAIAVYRTQSPPVQPNQKPIAVYTTFVTAGF